MKRFLKRLLCGVMLVFMSVVARPQARESLRYAEPFSVEGLEVGTPVAPNSHAYKRYKCLPSEQYLNSVTCRFSEVKNGVSKHLTILHLYNNIVIYVNKSVSPAFFSSLDISNEIERLSATFGGKPHIYSSNEGVIATWGDIQLEPLDHADLAALAEGKNPNMGFMVDHLMNYGDSAREGLPVYSLGGGKGYVWIARFGARGREGALRFLAADPSQMKLGAAEAPEVAPPYSPPPRQGASPPEAVASEELVKMEQEGGVYVVPLRINGAITLNAVVDSGASEVSIPADVVLTLIRAKTISDNDFLGRTNLCPRRWFKGSISTLSHSVAKGWRHYVRELCANVSSMNATMILLGQSFLGRFKSWSIDNDRHVLILK